MNRVQQLNCHFQPTNQLSVSTCSSQTTSSKRLEGKIAIITGAGSGIGRSSAQLFSQEGAKVYCVDIDPHSCNETIELIRKEGGIASGCHADVGSEDETIKFIQHCQKELGNPDIYFANAGISGSPVPIDCQSVEDFEKTLRINVIGVFLGIKHVSKIMIKKGGGSIICTASVAGLRSGAGPADYSCSKAAVISLCQTAANQLSGTNVRVNAICPGLTETGMTQPMFDFAREKGVEKKIGQLNPLKRGALAKEMATVALFLASSDSSYVNGIAIPVCGGLSSSHPTKPGSLDVFLIEKD